MAQGAVLVVTCEHCGAPTKRVQTCRYSGFLRQSGWSEDQVGNYEASGADPPCAHDEYEAGQRALDRQADLTILVMVALAVALPLLAGWFFF